MTVSQPHSSQSYCCISLPSDNPNPTIYLIVAEEAISYFTYYVSQFFFSVLVSDMMQQPNVSSVQQNQI